jgi:hypothetical protein
VLPDCIDMLRMCMLCDSNKQAEVGQDCLMGHFVLFF